MSYVVEYRGSRSGRMAPFLRDGAGHVRPKRKFTSGTGAVEVFMYLPPGARGDDWLVTPMKRVDEVYDEDIAAQLKRRESQVKTEHAQREQIWKQAQAVKTLRKGVLATSYIFNRLLENPKAFESGPTDAEKVAAYMAERRAAQVAGRPTADTGADD
ncbi:MAG: hypothetical protein AAFV29_22410 [Myxococcota bacterium]